MTTPIDQILPAETGERLRLARESAKMTQAAAAQAIGVARTTIVAMEQGERRAHERAATTCEVVWHLRECRASAGICPCRSSAAVPAHGGQR